ELRRFGFAAPLVLLEHRRVSRLEADRDARAHRSGTVAAVRERLGFNAVHEYVAGDELDGHGASGVFTNPEVWRARTRCTMSVAIGAANEPSLFFRAEVLPDGDEIGATGSGVHVIVADDDVRATVAVDVAGGTGEVTVTLCRKDVPLEPAVGGRAE